MMDDGDDVSCISMDVYCDDDNVWWDEWSTTLNLKKSQLMKISTEIYITNVMYK